METYATIFDKCQKNQAHHRASIAKLRALKDQDARVFVKHWLDLLNRVLVQSKKHQSVERLVKFIALAAVSFDEAFRDFTIQYVIRKTDARDWAPRYRACQILGATLKSLPEDAELGDALWDEIYTRMMDRLDDRAPAVRAEAVCAIQRLQDPSDERDPLVAQLVEMMRHDPSGDVRRTVVCSVAVCRVTLPEIVSRTKDVHAPVRRAAFRVLAQYVNIRNLKIAQRISLLRDGLLDRDERVRTECSKLCVAWLSHCERDVLALLRFIDVEEAEDAAEELLKVLFRDVQGGAPVAIDPSDKLSSEAALYMRVISEFWKSKVDNAAAQEAFETQVPELSAICEMMSINADNDFVLKQLLALSALKDFSDEVGRSSLSSLLRELLPSPQVSQFLVEPIVKVLSLCHREEEEFIQIVLELLSDVREPLDVLMTEEAKAGFQKAIQRRDEMRLNLQKLKKVARVCAAKGDSENVAKAERKAAALKEALDAAEQSIAARKRIEEHIWFRVLCVTELMLESTKQSLRHPGIHGLLEGVLMPSLDVDSVVVREKALRCLALYCLLDRSGEIIDSHISHFINACDGGADNVLELRTTAVRSLFDIGMLYGFNRTANLGQDKAEDLVQRLSRYIVDETEDMTLRGIVVEGFAKMYLMGQCTDAKLLGNLLLLFFSPSTSNDLRLRQCLSVFFPSFAFTSFANQALVAEAAIPSLRRILLSPPSSSFRKIDWALFCKFLAHLTDPAFAVYEFTGKSADPSWHEQIILRIAYEMRGAEKGHNPFWARALSHFSPSKLNPESANERARFVAKLYVAVVEAANESVDKRAKQWAEKRAASLREFLVEPFVLSNDMIREISDEIEAEVEQYMEHRHAEIMSLVEELNKHGGGAGSVVFESIVADERSPAKKKGRRTVAVSPGAGAGGDDEAAADDGRDNNNDNGEPQSPSRERKVSKAASKDKPKQKKKSATSAGAKKADATGIVAAAKQKQKQQPQQSWGISVFGGNITNKTK